MDYKIIDLMMTILTLVSQAKTSIVQHQLTNCVFKVLEADKVSSLHVCSNFGTY